MYVVATDASSSSATGRTLEGPHPKRPSAGQMSRGIWIEGVSLVVTLVLLAGRLSAGEIHEPHPLEALERVDGRLGLGRHRRIDCQRHQGVAVTTPDGHVGDVHAGLTENAPDAPDHARDVGVAQDRHVLVELDLDVEPEQAGQAGPRGRCRSSSPTPSPHRRST